MTLVLRLVARYALWIYILCGLGMVFYLRAALSARSEGTQAVFSLERESAAGRVYRFSGMILVLLLIVVGVYSLSHYVELPAPAASPIQNSQATTAAATATRPPTSLLPAGSTPTVESTPTRRPRTTVIVPPAIVQETPTPQVVPASCLNANVRVTQPSQNQTVDAGILVTGTAMKERFDRYEFKFQSSDFADVWHWVESFKTPVESGDLGFWATSHLPPGNYRFMLIVIDQTGNSQECVVPVVIQH